MVLKYDYPQDFWSNFKEYQKAMSFCSRNQIYISPEAILHKRDEVRICIQYKGQKKYSSETYTNKSSQGKCWELVMHFYKKYKDKEGFY